MKLTWITASWRPGNIDPEDLDLRIDRVPSAIDNTLVRYAVRHGGSVLNKDGVFEYEPMGSHRDEAFYVRCRFDTLEEAQLAADVWLSTTPYRDYDSQPPA